MKSVLVRWQEYSSQASETEKEIILYLLKNPEEVSLFSVHDFAKATFSSSSTIIRLCKKTGFQGYKEFQKAFLYELGIRRKSDDEKTKEIGREDSLEEIVSKVTYKNIISLENTRKLVDLKNLQCCVDILIKCNAINLFGIGSSLLVARDAHLKFLRINKSCYICDDWHAQLLQAKNMTKNDVAIMISYSGLTEEVLRCAREIKKTKAPIIAITRFEDSPLSRLADYTLWVGATEFIFRSGAMSSRISQLNMVDILYTAYVNGQYEESMKQFKRTHIEKPAGGMNLIDLRKLTTESRNKKTMDLDKMNSLAIVELMNKEDSNVISAVEKVLPDVAKVIDLCTRSLNQGGRIIYMGAGTSGRLGFLDAAECPPTFGVSPDVVVGLLAGGNDAFIKAVEGAEDSKTLGKEDLQKIGLESRDIVIGLAASGRTPYVIHGLKYARETGCATAAIACNKDSEIAKEADIAIEPVVGPEVLTGSTRLKAGTAQKMILNMISTASMIGVGKAFQNLMVDVMQSNEKLVVRTQNIVMEATGCDREQAEQVLQQADGSAKLAITAILLNCDVAIARQKLEKANGHVRNALGLS